MKYKSWIVLQKGLQMVISIWPAHSGALMSMPKAGILRAAVLLLPMLGGAAFTSFNIRNGSRTG